MPKHKPFLSYKTRWKIRQPFEHIASFLYHKMIDGRKPNDGWTIRDSKWVLNGEEVKFNKFAHGIEEALWAFLCGASPRSSLSTFMIYWRKEDE